MRNPFAMNETDADPKKLSSEMQSLFTLVRQHAAKLAVGKAAKLREELRIHEHLMQKTLDALAKEATK